MSVVPKVEIGSQLAIQKVVEEKDTAQYQGSGSLGNLLSTPSLVALIIEVSAKLVDRQLPDEIVTVGRRLEVIHEKPTIKGETVTVEATVKEFDGKKVLVEVIAYDELGQIGKAAHERIVVNNKLLLKNADERTKKLENLDF